MEYLGIVLFVLVLLVVAVVRRERRRGLAADATKSIRDHDSERRTAGVPDANRHGGPGNAL